MRGSLVGKVARVNRGAIPRTIFWCRAAPAVAAVQALGQPASRREISQSPQVLVTVRLVWSAGTVTAPLPRSRDRPSRSRVPVTGCPSLAWIVQSSVHPDRVVELTSQTIVTFGVGNVTSGQS